MAKMKKFDEWVSSLETKHRCKICANESAAQELNLLLDGKDNGKYLHVTRKDMAQRFREVHGLSVSVRSIYDHMSRCLGGRRWKR